LTSNAAYLPLAVWSVSIGDCGISIVPAGIRAQDILIILG